MQFFPIMYVPADIGSDISDMGLTQPSTTSSWISFKSVLTIRVVSTGTQTMVRVQRVLVVFVTRVVHITKVLWTSQLNAGYIIAASSTNPCLRDFLVRGIWILSSMASFPPAIPSARFVDNLKLKCESNICEAQSPCPEAWLDDKILEKLLFIMHTSCSLLSVMSGAWTDHGITWTRYLPQ